MSAKLKGEVTQLQVQMSPPGAFDGVPAQPYLGAPRFGSTRRTPTAKVDVNMYARGHQRQLADAGIAARGAWIIGGTITNHVPDSQEPDDLFMHFDRNPESAKHISEIVDFGSDQMYEAFDKWKEKHKY